MLSPSLRYDLRHDPEFFQRAQAIKSPNWTILHADAKTAAGEAKTPSPLRFAIIVKKTVASGVERSQIKRRVRAAVDEALRSFQADFDTPRAVVILPRRRALTTPLPHLAADLQKALSTLA